MLDTHHRDKRFDGTERKSKHKEQEQTRKSEMFSNPRSDSGHIEQLSRLQQSTVGWTKSIETKRIWHEQQEQTQKVPMTTRE
jgi:hypothetical protein